MRAAIALMALGALAACGSKDAKKPQGPAFEKVLPGSTSDAMLPYDTASSAPPLAPQTYESTAEPKSEAPRTKRPAEQDEVAPDVEAT
jgi:hypothetical protein